MNRKEQDSGQAPQPLADQRLTGQIVECFLTVYNTLDFGMLESVYRNALVVELSRRRIHARTEVPIHVLYRGVEVGFFRLDVLVEERVAVEVKATEALSPTARRQLLNYLRASSLDIGLLLHFGASPKVHRLVSPRVVERAREEQILPLP
jgi:GxxExxY protein